MRYCLVLLLVATTCAVQAQSKPNIVSGLGLTNFDGASVGSARF
jgi:hypothetical protein